MKKRSKFTLENTLRTILFLLFITILLFFGSIFAIYFILTLINHRENPCTKIPILSSLRIIKDCPINMGCIHDLDCQWNYEKVNGECRGLAENNVALRCADDLEIFRKDLDNPYFKERGYKTEEEICMYIMRSDNEFGYVGPQYYGWLNDCATQPPIKKAFCKKTDFDKHFKGRGVCALK